MFSFGRLRNLRVWQKLTLIVAVMAMAVPVIFYLISTRDAATIDFAQNERYGNEYLTPTRGLYARAVAYRDLVSVVIGGQSSFEPQLAPLRTAIEQDLTAIDAVQTARGSLLANNADRVPQRIKTMKDSWARLKGVSAQAGVSTTAHDAFVADVAGFITQIGDSSNLILDPDIDTYYLMSALITALPPLANDLGAARSLGASVAGRQTATIDERLRLAALLGRAQLNVDSVRNGMVDSAFPYNPSLGPAIRADLETLANEVARFQQLVDEQLTKPDKVAAAPAEVFNAGARAIDQAFKLYGLQLQHLDRLIGVRMDGFRADRFYILLGMSLGIIVALALTIVIARTITGQIGDVLSVFQRLGIGDFKARAAADAKDELGELARSLNAMLDNVTGLIQSREERDQMQGSIQKLLNEVSGVADGDLTAEAEVTTDVTGAIADSFNVMIGELRRVIGEAQAAARHVSGSANQLQAAAEQLAGGSDQQANQIVETSAAVEEMAASIQQVSQNAASSAAVAEQARSNAEQGWRAVSRTIDGMGSIRDQVQETAKRMKRLGESSQEVGEIVQVIGDIADRTSILALNASIQAAMAGEAGRGFAVVAEEVERLAERASEATKRIATLVKTTQSETAEAVAAMEDTTREVVSGSNLANEAGKALNEIQNVSNRLAELIQSISDASKQQAKSSEQVARSMTTISQVTRQTASGTKQAADSIGGLAKLADNLNGSMSRFKLPKRSGSGQGSVPAGVLQGQPRRGELSAIETPRR